MVRRSIPKAVGDAADPSKMPNADFPRQAREIPTDPASRTGESDPKRCRHSPGPTFAGERAMEIDV